MRNGEITAAVSNRLRETKNEWIIDTFDEQSIYIAMRKDDTVTQQLINDAISKINRDDPQLARTTLFNKYYTGSHTSSKIYLTDAEENYVIACNAADTVFTVLVNPDRYPYSYMTQDGVPTGIMVDIFQKAAGRARLRYKFLKPADRSEYKAMLADGQADFVIDLTDDMSQAENYGYKLTDSYPVGGVFLGAAAPPQRHAEQCRCRIRFFSLLAGNARPGRHGSCRIPGFL